MASLEVVVTPPGGWGDEQVEELADALGQVLVDFPGSSVEVRAVSPSLVAEFDQLKAMMAGLEADLAGAEVRTRWLRAPWGPAAFWAAGLGTGVGLTLAAVRLLT